MTYTLNRKNRILNDGKDTGYYLTRGSYYGTSDDCTDRWYVQHDDDTTIDRRGSGFATKQHALDELNYTLRYGENYSLRYENEINDEYNR